MLPQDATAYTGAADLSLMTQAYLLEKYGARLGVPALAAELGITPGTVRNQISQARFPVPTYLDNGQRFADYRDVAQYFDARRPVVRELETQS